MPFHFARDGRLEDADVVAVASRTQEAADRFGDAHGIARRHASYEALAADDDIDALIDALLAPGSGSRPADAEALAAWVDSLHLSPYALIAALTVMYIVLGTALDGISMIVLTTSIVVPKVFVPILQPTELL